MSIRYKIFGVFSIVIALACVLAFYGLRGISNSGDLVVRLYDGPLMGINHARSAHACLNEARLIMQRSLSEGTSNELVAKFEKMVGVIVEDLGVVRERISSPAVTAAREKAEARVREWSEAGLRILKPTSGGLTAVPANFFVVQQGKSAAEAIDDLVEVAAAYGYDYRAAAEETVAAARTTMVAIAIGTVVVGLLLAVAFAYSMGKPIGAAMRVAERVAGGNYTDHIEVRRRDELGRLLKSLGVMQASLKARADEDLVLMSSKDQTHADQISRRERIDAEIEAFRTTFSSVLASTNRMTEELTETAQAMSAVAREAGQQSTETASTAGATSASVQTLLIPPVNSPNRCRPSRRRSMTRRQSCSVPPGWLSPRTKLSRRSPAPHNISTKWSALSGISPVRPICWRLTPPSRLRELVRPVADLQ
jgi:methyl-accepting chemotaxis protein